MLKDFHCTRCGECCLRAGAHLQVADEDILMWEQQAPHILDYVGVVGDDVAALWVSPITGDEMRRCPWLRKYPKRDEYYCRIYDHRPKVCREFPTTVKLAKELACEGTLGGIPIMTLPAKK